MRRSLPSSKDPDRSEVPGESQVREKITDAAAPGRRACVLIAEDEERVRELAISILDANGFDAIVARQGGEALALLASRGHEIDAIVLDLAMPVVDGASMLAELQQQRPD